MHFADSTISNPVYDTAILVAGDEEDDALMDDDELRPFLDFAGEVAVYFARNDKLRQISVLL